MNAVLVLAAAATLIAGAIIAMRAYDRLMTAVAGLEAAATAETDAFKALLAAQTGGSTTTPPNLDAGATDDEVNAASARIEAVIAQLTGALPAGQTTPPADTVTPPAYTITPADTTTTAIDPATGLPFAPGEGPAPI